MKYLVAAATIAALIIPSAALAQAPDPPASSQVVMSHDEAWWATVKYMNHHFASWKHARLNKTTNLADGIDVSNAETIFVAKWIYKGKVFKRTVDITKVGFNKYIIKVRAT